LNDALRRSGVLNEEKLITDFEPVTGSEDFQMLVHGRKGVRIAYNFVGTAPPAVYAEARKEGKEVPFANHQPTYLVDLDAIPFGAKIAAIMVMDLMASN